MPQIKDYRIRRMVQDDVVHVMPIENAVHPFPWSEQIFRDCIRVGYLCWVLEREKEMRAFAVTSVSASECHILNVSVRPDEQRRGYGRALMLHCMGMGRQCGAKKAMLEVRISNDRARILYEDLGFTHLEIRKDYYPHADGREDAFIMEYQYL